VKSFQYFVLSTQNLKLLLMILTFSMNMKHKTLQSDTKVVKGEKGYQKAVER